MQTKSESCIMRLGLGGLFAMATPFGDYIRALRTTIRMSQRDAAAEVGITQAYLSAMELGKETNPSRDVLAGLARLYGVSYVTLAALVGGGEADAAGQTPLPLPGTADLPMPIARAIQRLGRYLTPADWKRAAAYLEGLAASRQALDEQAAARRRD